MVDTDQKNRFDLASLVASCGVELRTWRAKQIGTCPRCSSQLSVSQEQWSCEGGCGAGGAAQWVAMWQSVSVSHAAELVKSGWVPTGAPVTSQTSTVRSLPLLCDPAASDDELLACVVAHYRSCRDGCGEVLGRWNISDELADEVDIGFSNRSLGYLVPQANRREGKILRDRLAQLGVLRASGHEEMRGCVVVPVWDSQGRVVSLYGKRTTAPYGERWAKGAGGAVFNEASVCVDTVVVSSVFDALAVMEAGHRRVVAPGHSGGFTRADAKRLAKLGMRRAVLLGAHVETTAERFATERIECTSVAPGLSVARLLSSASNRLAALAELIGGIPERCEPLSESPPPRSASDREARLPGEAVVDEASDGQTEMTDSCNDGILSETTNISSDAPTRPATTLDAACETDEIRVATDRFAWRVRGAGSNKAPDSLKVALSVTCVASGRFHLDTLDLYQARQRNGFASAAADELRVSPENLRCELAEVIFAAEEKRDRYGEATVSAPTMSDTERDAALDYLRAPGLIERIGDDLSRLGVVGEETNLLVAYLATISRKAERPFGVVVQSSSAAGKSTLADTVCSLVPPEELLSFSAVTGQALYYLGSADLAHKVLFVAEEAGASRAAYALKLLVTEGSLSIASTGKDSSSGNLRTRAYSVSGPVALVMTTTSTEIDPELANRLVVLGVDEDAGQTRAIHAAQRAAMTIDGLSARMRRAELTKLHRNIQRLLDPLCVVVPDDMALHFPDHATRHRRDHQKLLSLVCAVALVHQHQLERKSIDIDGTAMSYVEASPEHVELAVGLAAKVFGSGLDELSPQARRLLQVIEEQCASAVTGGDEGQSPVALTRREMRELLGWSERQVRCATAHLVALEYLVDSGGGRGRSHRYSLVQAPMVEVDPASPPPRRVSRRTSSPAQRGKSTRVAASPQPYIEGARAIAVGMGPGADR